MNFNGFFFFLAGQIPGYPGMDPLQLHQAVAVSSAYQRQPMLPPRDAMLGLHPDILSRQYPPELAHHVSREFSVFICCCMNAIFCVM